MNISWNDVMKFDLVSQPVIFDVGGFQGDWTNEALLRYPNAEVYVFEPVKSFYESIKRRYENRENIKVFNFGLSDQTKSIEISVGGDASSTHRVIGVPEKIRLKNIKEFIEENSIDRVDLIKINIEGEEYPLMKFLVQSDRLTTFKNFLIQFHDFVPDYAEKRRDIQEELLKKYNQSFNFEMVFEGWTIK